MIFTIFISAIILYPLLKISNDSYKRIKENGVTKSIISYILIFSIIGLILGYWLGFNFEYQISEKTRIMSAPLPVGFWKKEGDNWTDFITPAPLLNASLNLLIITLISLIPINFIVRKITKNKIKDNT